MRKIILAIYAIFVTLALALVTVNLSKTSEKLKTAKETLERILTVKLDNKGLISVVERRLKNGKVLKEIMSTEDLKKTNPWILIDYYEGKIKFA